MMDPQELRETYRQQLRPLFIGLGIIVSIAGFFPFGLLLFPFVYPPYVVCLYLLLVSLAWWLLPHLLRLRRTRKQLRAAERAAVQSLGDEPWGKNQDIEPYSPASRAAPPTVILVSGQSSTLDDDTVDSGPVPPRRVPQRSRYQKKRVTPKKNKHQQTPPPASASNQPKGDPLMPPIQPLQVVDNDSYGYKGYNQDQ